MGYLYIIWKGNTRYRGLNFKSTVCTQCLWGWGFHAKSVFFFKCFYWWLAIYVFIIGLFYICLSIGQTLEKVQFTSCLLKCRWRRGKLIWIGSIKWKPGKQVYLDGIAVRENYVWCLAIVTKFKGLGGGTNRLGKKREGLKSFYGHNKPQREWGLK